MMNATSVRGDIQSLLRVLNDNEMALQVRPVVINTLPLSTGGQNGLRVTWARPQNPNTALFQEQIISADNYRSWLASEEYSALLFDGSILQISYDFRGNNLIGHRLVYYPCPYDVDQELLRLEPVLDVIGLYAGIEDNVRLRSPIRFDFDVHAASDEHPAAHVTLFWSHCRWAISAPVSLGHFVRFIFKNFYPSHWFAHASLRNWPQNHLTLTITDEQAKHLHIASAR